MRIPSLLNSYSLKKVNQYTMKLFIKYMVSSRCIMAVKEVLKKFELHYIFIELGEVEIMESISDDLRAHLKKALKVYGFELMEDKRAILIEKIKVTVIEMVHYSTDIMKVNFSEYLSQKLNYDYSYMTKIFSEVQGTTIEHFIIIHKIERIKEFIIYDELNITEIAQIMNYSSVAHLSTQFKKITGLTPSAFKNLRMKRRYPLESI